MAGRKGQGLLPTPNVPSNLNTPMPGSDLSHQNSQSCNKVMEKFPKSCLFSGLPIGQGGFGSVIKGKINNQDVVVKILHTPIGQKRHTTLQTIFNLKHRNLLLMMGMIDTDPSECPQLIYMQVNNGNMLDYLRQQNGVPDELTLTKYGCDIVSGMEYLHQQNFIHGCLSSRNVLLHQSRGFVNAKVSDYGMPQVIQGMGANYPSINANGSKTLPIRWMPKEAISIDGPGPNRYNGEVTKPSDVWSFGVVFWEMWTSGEIPYGPATSNTDVKQYILNGSSPLTFTRPQHCPQGALNVMQNIFTVNKDARPTFGDLKTIFDAVLQSMGSRSSTLPENKPTNANHSGALRNDRARGRRDQSRDPHLQREHFDNTKLMNKYPPSGGAEKVTNFDHRRDQDRERIRVTDKVKANHGNGQKSGSSTSRQFDNVPSKHNPHKKTDFKQKPAHRFQSNASNTNEPRKNMLDQYRNISTSSTASQHKKSVKPLFPGPIPKKNAIQSGGIERSTPLVVRAATNSSSNAPIRNDFNYGFDGNFGEMPAPPPPYTPTASEDSIMFNGTFPLGKNLNTTTEALEKEVRELQNKIDAMKVQQKIGEIEDKVNSLEQKQLEHHQNKSLKSETVKVDARTLTLAEIREFQNYQNQISVLGMTQKMGESSQHQQHTLFNMGAQSNDNLNPRPRPRTSLENPKRTSTERSNAPKDKEPCIVM